MEIKIGILKKSPHSSGKRFYPAGILGRGKNTWCTQRYCENKCKKPASNTSRVLRLNGRIFFSFKVNKSNNFIPQYHRKIFDRLIISNQYTCICRLRSRLESLTLKRSHCPVRIHIIIIEICNMIRFFNILIAIVSASVNAVSTRRISFSLKMRFESEIGAQPPLGFWDPLGFLENANKARFDRLREVETKHGRIAM